jgi:sugar lactone lactonase YvrE
VIPVWLATLAIDARDRIGEAPCWDAHGNRLLWSDNENGVIHEATATAAGTWAESRRWSLNRPVAGALARTAGGLVVAAGSDIWLLDAAGKLTSFATLGPLPRDMWINEIKCDPQGRLWAGTIAGDFAPRAALYRIDPDRRVTQILDRVSVSNGMDWSPDGTAFYYIDSMTRAIEAFDFDAVSGTISRRRTLLEIPLGEGLADGMTVDTEGCLWVAMVGAGEVRRFAPDGTLLARMAISTPAVTSCAFGGPDGRDLFITSLGRRMPDIVMTLGITRETVERAAIAADGGGLFVCRPGPAGAPAHPFAG